MASYKLTQLKNIDDGVKCYVGSDPVWMGGAIAAHQAGVLDLREHLIFVDKDLQYGRPDDWCIAEEES